MMLSFKQFLSEMMRNKGDKEYPRVYATIKKDPNHHDIGPEEEIKEEVKHQVIQQKGYKPLLQELEKHPSQTRGGLAKTHRELSAHHGNAPLEKHELHALREYTGQAYHLNKALYAGKAVKGVHHGWSESTPLKTIHENLDKAIKKAPPLKDSVHVFSGVSNKTVDMIKKAASSKHQTIHMPAYTSTSIDHETARGFCKSHNRGRDEDHILHFHLPKGYKGGRYVGGGKHRSKMDYERELILNHNQKFKIQGHTHFKPSKDSWDTPTHIWHLTPA